MQVDSEGKALVPVAHAGQAIDAYARLKML